MRKIAAIRSFFSIVIVCLLCRYISTAQTAGVADREQNPVDRATIAERLWYSHETEWKAGMIQKLKSSPAAFNAFIEYVMPEYGKDRRQFFMDVINDVVTEENAARYFDNITSKYISYYNSWAAGQGANPKNPSFGVNSDGGGLPSINACNPSCTNMGFQNSTLSGWTAYYANQNSSNAAINLTNKTGGACGSVVQAAGPHPGTGSSYHVQLQTTPGSDPVAGPLIPLVPPLGGLCAMVGDGPNVTYGVGILEQTYQVTAAEPILTLQYALVLQNPNHQGYEQPFFQMEVLDQNGNPVPGCGQYFVVSSSNLPGSSFTQVQYGGTTTYVKPWATAFVPLYNLIGQCVTVRFTAADCAAGGHFGYAYVAASCTKLQLVSSSNVFCNGQTSATITGPPGAASYQWTTPNGCISGSSTGQKLTITCGGTYKLTTTASAGAQCVDTFSITIPNVNAGPPPVPCFTATRVCSGNPTSFNASCSNPNTGLRYFWDFYNSGPYQDSTTGANPAWIFGSGGNYKVRLHVVDSNGCGGDTVINVPVDSTFTSARPTVNLTTTNASACTQCNGTVRINFSNASSSNPVRITNSCNGCTVTVGGGISSTGCSGTSISSSCVNGVCSGSVTLNNVCPGICYFYARPTTATGPTVCNPGGWAGDTIIAQIGVNGVTIGVVQNSTPATCGLSNGSSSLTGTGGTAPYTFTWSNGLGTGATKTGLAPGNYTVTIRDANGCPGSAIVKIASFPQLGVVAVPYNVSCYGANDGALKISPLGGTGPFTYTWTPSITTTDSIGGLSPGSYTVSVRDINGCSGSFTANITQPTQLITAVTGSTLIPCNSTGNASVTVSGGYPPYTYSWSNGATTSSVTGISPGSYTVTVTDGVGCKSTQTHTITTPPPPNLTVSPNAAICIGANTQLTSSGGTTYAWSPPAGLNFTNISNPSANPTITTTYTVLITDANGCNGTLTTTVTVNPLPTVGISPPSTICIGASVTLTASGGTGYIWQPGGTPFPSTTITPGSTSAYTVTVTDGNGCINTGTTTVTVNPLPIVGISNPAPVCIGSSVQLTASGGGTYSWSDGQSGSPITVTLPAGTHPFTVTVTDGNNCVNTGTATVTVNPLPIAGITPPATVCIGTPVQLTASGGNNYSWSPGTDLSGTTGSAVTSTPSATITYTVTVTDGNGCSSTVSTTITVNLFLSATAGPNTTICAGDSVQLTSSSVGATIYSWSPPGSLNNATLQNPTATPASTTTYTVAVSNANGCNGSATVTVTVNPLPTVNINNPAPVCIGTSVQLTASGAGSGTYSWSDGQSGTPITVNLPVGTHPYTVTVTDGNGCTGTGTAVVTINALPVVAVNSAIVCTGASASLTASGGIGYSWSSGQLTQTITVTPPVGVNPYTVTVVDNNGCVNTGTATVTVHDLPVVSVNNATICTGTTATLTATGGTQYVWSSGQTGPSITVSPPVGTTPYTVVVTDANGCINSATTSVTVNPLPVVSVSATMICGGANATLTASGGTGYLWSNGQTSAAMTANPVVTTTYTVIVTDNNGCVSSGTGTISVYPAPNITISPNTSYCSGNSTQLTAGGGISYSWTPATGLDFSNIPNPLASPTATTTYTVNVIDVNGCTGSNMVTVTVLPLPTADAGPDRDICVGEKVQLNATGGFTYSWNPPTGLNSANIPNPVSTVPITTTYIVTVSNGACPPAMDTITITVHPIPPIYAGADTLILAGTEITLHATGGGITYQWTPSTALSCVTCPNPNAKPLKTTTYIVYTTDAYGCRNRDTVTIYVEDCLTLYVPNAFTPYNTDQRNDIFYAYGTCIYEFEFYIYDRWGAKVFETTDPYIGWDGTYKGQFVQQDVYVWVAKARSVTGLNISKTGSVTVLR